MAYDFSIIEKECEALSNKIDISKLKNKKVLITGASGLIGSFIADFLNFMNKKYDFNIKILLTSYGSPSGFERIKHLINNPNIEYFSWDASTLIKEENIKDVEYVFFCSGYGQPTKFTKDNIKTSFINTVGINSILKILEKKESSNFLFVSSSEIYGDPDDSNIPTKEEYNGNYSLSNSRAAYICSKRLGEIICEQYSDKIDIKIARVGLIYGPGVLFNDDRVLQNFIFKAKQDNEISMLDSGSSIRNYLYLTDGIEMLFNILLNGKNKVYNVGGYIEPISIYNLAEIVSSYFKCRILMGNNNNNNIVKNSPKNVCMDMSKYKEEFKSSIENPVKLHEGILKVIKWYNFYEEKDEN